MKDIGLHLLLLILAGTAITVVTTLFAEPDDEEANYIESHNEAPTDPIAALRQPREYVVRLYVLQGINLMG